ncbi:hypothetical protein ACFQ8W_00265 [Streptomyces sp. NPDC056508]|uniref:hypothetical protein n=1 Tax=Streptomyces sp. NPDC056508 TaxID=3345845 RepID=UPI0036D19E03
MPFYRDIDGSIWVPDHRGDRMFCLLDPLEEGDTASVGMAMEPDEVRRQFGPLEVVRATGWEEDE